VVVSTQWRSIPSLGSGKQGHHWHCLTTKFYTLVGTVRAVEIYSPINTSPPLEIHGRDESGGGVKSGFKEQKLHI
jgi:hypothetical protein